METCILEYFYFNTRTRSILSEVRTCRQEAAGKGSNLGECLKGVKDKVEGLKGEVSGMVEVSKREINSEGAQ
jgi:hypothetical protein